MVGGADDPLTSGAQRQGPLKPVAGSLALRYGWSCLRMAHRPGRIGVACSFGPAGDLLCRSLARKCGPLRNQQAWRE